MVQRKYTYSSLALLLCIAFIGVSLVYVRTHRPEEAARDDSVLRKDVPRRYQITYTDKGFSPEVLEVPLGSEVVFTNNSTIPLWTASDPHPTHTDYPEFDSMGVIDLGQTFTFVFAKSGTFGFHNHEKSLHRGIVRVVGVGALPVIDKTKERQRGVRDKYLAMFVPGDPTSVYKVMDAIEKSPAVFHDCHDMAHDLGHRAYELYGFSGAMTFGDPQKLSSTSTDDICAGGYMHGIVEELLLHQPELQYQPAKICADVPYINRGSCFHGLGHSLMFADHRDLSASLATCKSLGHMEDEHRCYEGVWMEFFWGDVGHGTGSSLGWDEADPLAPCAHANDEEKPACFLYAHLGYLRTHRADFTGMRDLCLQNNLGPKDKRYCLKGIGITMMKYFGSHHLVETEPLAQPLSAEGKYAYYQGVIGYARLSGVGEDDLRNFCTWLVRDRLVCESVLVGGTD